MVGVDNSDAIISEAKKRSEGLDLPFEFYQGSAHHLEFPDSTFDGCQAVRVFQHLDDPRQALREMLRVVRPGGRIAVQDPDPGTFFGDAPDRVVTRKILDHRAESRRNPWMGRQLFGLFRDAGLTDIVVEPMIFTYTDPLVREMGTDGIRAWAQAAQEAGVVSAEEAEGWVASLEEAAAAGRYFLGFLAFVVGGKRP